MSVLIKGMEMPKDCVSCRWHTRWGCEITGIVTNTAQGCPLIEVPAKHGRLIDADELMLQSVSGTESYHISAAPTIIEAEESFSTAFQSLSKTEKVEVIRCKDCRWGREVCGNIECFVDSNIPTEYHGYEWFCPNGERREEKMRVVCMSETYCPYKSDTGYCGYTAECIKNREQFITVKVPKTSTYATVMLVDISDESINKIAKAVIEKLRCCEANMNIEVEKGKE